MPQDDDPQTAHHRILRYRDGVWSDTDDPIVTEQPVTIMLNGAEFATLVCSPGDIEELVIGFLASEGVLSRIDQIRSLAYDEKDGFAYVEAERLNPYVADSHSKRYLGSCCGKSRQGFYFWSDARTARKVEARRIRLTPQDCFRLMDELERRSATFRETGGVHNAALIDEGGQIRLSCSDIGRHNALDKIYGHLLRSGGTAEGTAIAFSGRISSEILLKAAKIGSELLLTKSAPTALALQLADQLGLTAVGFIRGDSLNVYTHPDRIVRP